MIVSLEKHLTEIHSQWQPATWQEYEHLRDSLGNDSNVERVQLFFHDNQVLVENMGWESLLHSEVRELFSAILVIWLMRHREIKSKILGSCLMEKSGKQAAAPDIALYLGDNLPKYREGEPRSINLDRDRISDLVVEIADTTLDSDLDQKKHLYAELGVIEYWVIDAKSAQVFIFLLQNQTYSRAEGSQLLPDFTTTLLSETIEQMKAGSNISAAMWFSEKLFSSTED